VLVFSSCRACLSFVYVVVRRSLSPRGSCVLAYTRLLPAFLRSLVSRVCSHCSHLRFVGLYFVACVPCVSCECECVSCECSSPSSYLSYDNYHMSYRAWIVERQVQMQVLADREPDRRSIHIHILILRYRAARRRKRMGTAGKGEGRCAGLLVSESPLACSVFYLSFFLIHIQIDMCACVLGRACLGALTRVPCAECARRVPRAAGCKVQLQYLMIHIHIHVY
jgi:hypothetical protein